MGSYGLGPKSSSHLIIFFKRYLFKRYLISVENVAEKMSLGVIKFVNNFSSKIHL